uniref:Uncharacterized protein n=1 Tax=Ixodes ricinus TaxID=34613 RepID=A0A6B0ULG6_IXORI
MRHNNEWVPSRRLGVEMYSLVRARRKAFALDRELVRDTSVCNNSSLYFLFVSSFFYFIINLSCESAPGCSVCFLGPSFLCAVHHVALAVCFAQLTTQSECKDRSFYWLLTSLQEVC